MREIPDISVVVLCYRSGKQIYDFVDRIIQLMEDLGTCWELVLVGNYFKNSDDDTPLIVKDIASKYKNIVAITLPKQGMMGWDARTGLSKASARFICLIDGDGQMPAEDIIRVYNKIKQDNLDFVSTYRVKRYDNLIRTTNSYIYNLLFKILFPGLNLKDVNAKPKILRREAYEKMHLLSDDWFLDAEIVIQCRRLKFKIGQIPTSFYKCTYRKSFVKLNTIFEFIKNLIIARTQEFFH